MALVKLIFQIDIQAEPKKIWKALWDKENYTTWCNAFCEGTYYESEFNEGDRIHFIAPNGDGMYADIEEKIENEYIAFCHLGELKNYEEQPLNDETMEWTGATEDYRIIPKDNFNTLEVTIDTMENYLEYFKTHFPKGLEKVKEIAEQL